MLTNSCQPIAKVFWCPLKSLFNAYPNISADSACTLMNTFELQPSKQRLPAVRAIREHAEEAEYGAGGRVEGTLTRACLQLTACHSHLAISECPVPGQQSKLHQRAHS